MPSVKLLGFIYCRKKEISQDPEKTRRSKIIQHHNSNSSSGILRASLILTGITIKSLRRFSKTLTVLYAGKEVKKFQITWGSDQQKAFQSIEGAAQHVFRAWLLPR
ncbi:hypothetical protein BV898_16346 [Hypsibius exemplaris]|uniref:Uncharacterized protein n=1 Tax=Hypsibius exemplaris TaxID=2072580 RepID=A0A9X6ND04_HYPEX|nr:hypothetical protein BV898_16346 [Hypsibius exemplaris]